MVYSETPISLLLGWVFALAFVFYSFYSANWRSFRRFAGVQHFFAGAVLVITGLWCMHAGIKRGLDFHILGLTSLTLLMGWRFALLAGAFVVSSMVGFGKISFQEWGLSYALVVVIPVLFTYLIFLHVYRRLPCNPFVYILVAGFLTAGVTQALHAVTVSGFYWLDDTYTGKELWLNYLRFLPLMMFPEGVINGMFLAGMVSFHPQWLSTFDQDSYFN